MTSIAICTYFLKIISSSTSILFGNLGDSMNVLMRECDLEWCDIDDDDDECVCWQSKTVETKPNILGSILRSILPNTRG